MNQGESKEPLNTFAAGGNLVISTADDLDDATSSGEWIAGSPVEVRQ